MSTLGFKHGVPYLPKKVFYLDEASAALQALSNATHVGKLVVLNKVRPVGKSLPVEKDAAKIEKVKKSEQAIRAWNHDSELETEKDSRSMSRHTLFVSGPTELQSYLLEIAETYSALNPHAAYDIRTISSSGPCAARRNRAGDVILILEQASSEQMAAEPLGVPYRLRAEVWESQSHTEADNDRVVLRRVVRRIDLCVGDRDLASTIPPRQVAL